MSSIRKTSTKILFLSEMSVVLLTANLLVIKAKYFLTATMASSFRGTFCIKRSKGVFGAQSTSRMEFMRKNVTALSTFAKTICLLPWKSAKLQLLNKISEILHKFVILICFSKKVVLKAAPDSKPISNFNKLHQRSFFKCRLQMFFKIVVPKNFANLTGKH